MIGVPLVTLASPSAYYQSIYYARALSGKIKMPSIADMKKEVDDGHKKIKELGNS